MGNYCGMVTGKASINPVSFGMEPALGVKSKLYRSAGNKMRLFLLLRKGCCFCPVPALI